MSHNKGPERPEVEPYLPRLYPVQYAYDQVRSNMLQSAHEAYKVDEALCILRGRFTLESVEEEHEYRLAERLHDVSAVSARLLT